jgi:hypothetical protein
MKRGNDGGSRGGIHRWCAVCRDFAPGSDRRFAIRNKITEYENILRKDREAAEVIDLFLQLSKDRAFEQSFRHMVNFRPTPTSEFFQEVLDELSLRIRLTIGE